MLYIGKIVLWYPSGDPKTRPCPATVLQVGDEALSLAIVQENIRNTVFKDGVRQVGDPKANDNDKMENGLWDYTANEKPTLSVPPKKEPAK